MFNRTFQKRAALLCLAALLFGTLAFRSSTKVRAANLTEASMRLNRMSTSITDNTILVIAKPMTTATEASVKITFASGFTVDSTASNITVSTSGLPSTYQGESLTAWPGIGSAASAVSGQNVTVASSDLTAGTEYGFFITAGIDNPSSAAQYINVITTQTSGPATIDTSDVAVRIVSSDQVSITATVPATFSFTLGATSDTFASDLSSSSVVSTSGVSVTVATNAAKGWVVWAKSANAALASATTGTNIDTSGLVDAAPTTLSTGSNGYVLDVNLTSDSGTGTGSVTIDPEYNGSTTSAGGTLSTTLQPLASATGTTDGDVITLVARASISAVQAAADDYTDTLTVVGAGNF